MSRDTPVPERATPITAVEVVRHMRTKYRRIDLTKSSDTLATEEGRLRYAMRESAIAVVEDFAKEFGIT